MGRRRWVRWTVVGVVALLVIGAAGYLGYVGYEGSRRMVAVDELRSRDCRTPDVEYGWTYEAINYDIANDAQLRADNPDMSDCASQGTQAGNEVVTSDGVPIGGWYIPAANGIGPTGPTVILVHGYRANKSGMLKYGVGLHTDFNLVAFDLRNGGRSGGTQTTYGIREKNDLRAIIDWLVAAKHPSAIGVLGDSLGAATTVNEVVTDDRVAGVTLDSMHVHVVSQIEQNLRDAGHPPYPGTWAILVGDWVRTGLNLADGDPAHLFDQLVARQVPILMTHGTADKYDPPAETQKFETRLSDAGASVELHMCAGAVHGGVVDTCPDDFAQWVHDFFTRTLSPAA